MGMESVGSDFPNQQARARQLLREYRMIGPAGTFGAAGIEKALDNADKASMSGDPIEILRSYEELKGLK